jgi:hypothetical protein
MKKMEKKVEFKVGVELEVSEGGKVVVADKEIWMF